MSEHLSPTSQHLIDTVDRHGAHNYLPLPVVLRRGQGSKVWDVDGKEYLDFLACYSALNFGHQHPKLVQAMQAQVGKLALCSRAFYSEELCLFSEELAKLTGHDSVLTMNSGAEAVESAIKLARKWGYQKKKVAPDKAKIIVFENNFHGRTVTIVSFSSEDDYRAGFGPFTPGFHVVPFNDPSALENAIDENTVAVLAEPIQAEAGILVPSAGFAKTVRKICTEKKVLWISDEIQTGLGRTGKNFCYEHDGVIPDVVVLGKSLGGGLVPLSAVVANRDVMDVIRPGQHGSTFGGNPLACAIGRATLRLLTEEKFADRATHIGKKILSHLQSAKLPKVREIRGRGALVGIELEASAGGARRYCEEMARRGVLCKETHTVVIRLAPPLVIEDAELDRGLQVIEAVIRELSK